MFFLVSALKTSRSEKKIETLVLNNDHKSNISTSL